MSPYNNQSCIYRAEHKSIKKKHFSKTLSFETTNHCKVANYRNVSYLFKMVTFIKLAEPVCVCNAAKQLKSLN